MEKTLTRAERMLTTIFLFGVFYGASLIGYSLFIRADKISSQLISINWQQLYPFDDEQVYSTEDAKLQPFWEDIIGSIDSKFKLSFIKDKIRKLTTEKLVGYQTIVDTSKQYERLIDWNMASIADYNGVIRLSDGYFTAFTEKRDVTESARSTIELATFCKKSGINFLYVNAPCKVCQYEDNDVTGILDFANQNADEFLKMLSDSGVKYCDLRKMLHNERMSHHGSFYRTDNHWLLETTLWAASCILQSLHEYYDYPLNISALESNNFRHVDYPASFLGAYGKKMTLSRAIPDDFSLLYPNYPTHLHCEIPNIGLDAWGDFSILYNLKKLEGGIDYYGKHQYNDVLYNDGHIIKVENTMSNNEIKLLVIRDSMGGGTIQFLALGVKGIEALEYRYFNGSFQNYIKSTQPDVVIVLYTAEQIGIPINWGSHGSPWDFR